MKTRVLEENAITTVSRPLSTAAKPIPRSQYCLEPGLEILVARHPRASAAPRNGLAAAASAGQGSYHRTAVLRAEHSALLRAGLLEKKWISTVCRPFSTEAKPAPESQYCLEPGLEILVATCVFIAWSEVELQHSGCDTALRLRYSMLSSA